MRSGDRAVLGRALTLVESQHPQHRRLARQLLRDLLEHGGAAQRIGISGVPGVGKSTFIESFGRYLLDLGHRVAVLAVDPSSEVSGGSILGDKTRMAGLASDERAFIRPSPAGGSLGGVARSTRESIVVCEAAGYDVIIVETVGVGQSETLVAQMVDVFLALMLAGGGDELQGIKRGILEVVDLVAINKADGENRVAAERSRAELESALQILRAPDAFGWTPRVVTCSALQGTGVEHIWGLIEEHRRALGARGVLERRRLQRVLWMWSLVDESLRHAVREHHAVADALPRLEREVLEGRSSPTEAAESILELFGIGGRDR